MGHPLSHHGQHGADLRVGARQHLDDSPATRLSPRGRVPGDRRRGAVQELPSGADRRGDHSPHRGGDVDSLGSAADLLVLRRRQRVLVGRARLGRGHRAAANRGEREDRPNTGRSTGRRRPHSHQQFPLLGHPRIGVSYLGRPRSVASSTTCSTVTSPIRSAAFRASPRWSCTASSRPRCRST